MVVVPQTRVEAEHFYEDLFEKRIYLRYGITLEPGDCVFDVGGNIGMFALFAHSHAPGARIYTFEPVPALFQRLRANLALNGTAAFAFNHGIAEAERTARFTFYPNSSGMSSFYADAGEEREVLRLMMDRQREDGVEGMDALVEYTDELLDERFRAVEMECRLRPLSAIIREEGVERIDFLKIDVQKAEMDVLRGIAPRDWSRIRQIVMEVHDIGGRLAEVTGLLERYGFRVAVEQDEAVAGSVLYNLFAVSRSIPPRGPVGTDATEGCAQANPWHLLLLSASSRERLDAAGDTLAGHLTRHPELPLADVGFTLRREAPALPHRRAWLARDGEDLPALLADPPPARTWNGIKASEPSVAFLFPGVGEQYPGMAGGVYGAEPVFRAEFDRCARLLEPHVSLDLREALLAPRPKAGPGKLDLRRMLERPPASGISAWLSRTEVAQPLAFAVGYALARLWESWGIRPAAVLGHSLGEYTAACVAGVFQLEDALELVAVRARGIQALPGGAMLAVSLSPEGVHPWLGAGVSLAAVNARELCVLSGTEDAIGRVEHELAQAGYGARRLEVTHAFHSPLMRDVAEQIAALVNRMRLSPPRIPLLSNVTGSWLTAGEVADPEYWARHLVETVHFTRGAAELLAGPERALVEVGPGGSLGVFVRQEAAASGKQPPPAVASLPHAADDTPDPAYILGALGRLWAAGVEPDWSYIRTEERRRRVPLPGVLFEHAEAAGVLALSGAADGSGEEDRGGGDPGEVTRMLAADWHELLGVKPRLSDDFFLLGGHSLVAAQLIVRVRSRFGIDMRLRNLFQTRTLFELARWIENAVAAQGEAANPD